MNHAPVEAVKSIKNAVPDTAILLCSEKSGPRGRIRDIRRC